MPDMPPTLTLPNASGAQDPFLTNWASQENTALIAYFRAVVQLVNALSKVDTAANRATTPDFDHILFTESDSNQTYVAINGVWTSLGEQRDSRRYALLVG